MSVGRMVVTQKLKLDGIVQILQYVFCFVSLTKPGGIFKNTVGCAPRESVRRPVVLGLRFILKQDPHPHLHPPAQPSPKSSHHISSFQCLLYFYI